MDHCAGGEGASAIDYMGAITAWVEGGMAPEALRGVHILPGALLDYFGVGLPNLDRRYYAFERDHHAYPQGSVAIGKDRAAFAYDRSLAVRRGEAMAMAEKTAAGARFPRQSTLNAVLKSAWELFYRSGAEAGAQEAALAAVSPLASSVGREAVARLRAELALD